MKDLSLTKFTCLSLMFALIHPLLVFQLLAEISK